ncbi:MAG: type III-B CRISPR-associated protein Cas10/Cmr2 [Verrucomicrobia bacterium]|nr:type III-B CRISPR-associated protein Cas10/Cmr2 [Verrucomicrobiota bacterium]
MNQTSITSTIGWKRKLDAYLHDPPEKVLDLAWHKKRAQNYASGLPLDDAEFARDCDHTAAAADRLPWPKWEYLESVFDGDANRFKHPLGQAALKIPPFNTADFAHDKAWITRPMILEDDDRARFFAFWRLWRWWASEQDLRLAFLPADTRLPDHTIWVHNSIVSALQTCVTGNGPGERCQPAFLLFQIGPVQEYIAQARRTLDLWSGSYLLSYLIGTALKYVALNYGPDCVIFPNLCGQPIFDLLLQDDLWSKIHVQNPSANSNQSLWDAFGYEKTRDGQPNEFGRRRLLTPSLPNRFLAVLPAESAASIAAEAANVIRDAYSQIAEQVWSWAAQYLENAGCWTSANKQRYDAQIARFLEISWQVVRWPVKPHEALDLTRLLPSDASHNPRSGLETILAIADNTPLDHRDVRNFECPTYPPGTKNPKGMDISKWKDVSKLKPDAKLDNPGAAWSALYQLAAWQLDAVRQTRAWKAWSSGGWETGRVFNKDSLNGKEEAILVVGSSEKEAEALNQAAGIENLFKPGELFGASTLVKRLWPTAWLQKKHRFQKSDWRMPDTRHIADAAPFAKSDKDEEDPDYDADRDDSDDRDAQKYFAVLALDGDQIGKWISGLHDRMPTLGEHLSNYIDPDDRQTKGAKKYFEEHGMAGFLQHKRPLNPSFHLQFSEMLANFGNFCVRRIVEAHDGRLVYSGGDDVLALLPAHQAIPCAIALRAAFRGDPKVLNKLRGTWRFRAGTWRKEDALLFDCDQKGFVRLHKDAPSNEGEPKRFYAIVPGPAADCSVGIAIAHFKHPLQDTVREAQAAEKRAKTDYGRSAIAITLAKRSGETIHWGCKWESHGLDAYSQMMCALQEETVSEKFPHRIIELVQRYQTDHSGKLGAIVTTESFENIALDVLKKEIDTAADRQRGVNYNADKVKNVRDTLVAYLSHPDLKSADEKVRALAGLCQTVAFVSRNLPKQESKATQETANQNLFRNTTQPAERQTAS